MKPVIYSGLLSGSGWIEDPVKMAGKHIPIIPAYGKRYFVDNQERAEGHIRKVKDAQRLENLMVSMIADNASKAAGDNIPIVDIGGIPPQMAHHWENRNINRPAFLPVTNVKDKNGNVIVQNPIVGNTGVTQMSPALAGLLQYTGTAIEKISGFHGIEHIPSNIATDTVDSIFNRIDTQSFIYMDNIALTYKRIAEVWLDMKRELTGSDKIVRMMSDEGRETFGLMSDEVIDKETGKTVALNDLSVGAYDVDIDISESTDSQRKAAAKSLIELMKVIPPQSPLFNTIASHYAIKMDGYKIDDMQEVIRERMLMSGELKPKTKEEEMKLAQAQQAQSSQPNPAAIMAQAEMQKSQADLLSAQTRGFEAQTKAFSAQNKADKEQAEIMQILNSIDESKRNQIIEQIRLMKDLSQDAFNDVSKLQ